MHRNAAAVAVKQYLYLSRDRQVPGHHRVGTSSDPDSFPSDARRVSPVVGACFAFDAGWRV